MKRIQLLLAACLFVFNVHAQNETILTINGEDVSKSDFEYVFKKNNTDKFTLQPLADGYR